MICFLHLSQFRMLQLIYVPIKFKLSFLNNVFIDCRASDAAQVSLCIPRLWLKLNYTNIVEILASLEWLEVAVAAYSVIHYCWLSKVQIDKYFLWIACLKLVKKEVYLFLVLRILYITLIKVPEVNYIAYLTFLSRYWRALFHNNNGSLEIIITFLHLFIQLLNILDVWTKLRLFQEENDLLIEYFCLFKLYKHLLIHNHRLPRGFILLEKLFAKFTGLLYPNHLSLKWLYLFDFLHTYLMISNLYLRFALIT